MCNLGAVYTYLVFMRFEYIKCDMVFGPNAFHWEQWITLHRHIIKQNITHQLILSTCQLQHTIGLFIRIMTEVPSTILKLNMTEQLKCLNMSELNWPLEHCYSTYPCGLLWHYLRDVIKCLLLSWFMTFTFHLCQSCLSTSWSDMNNVAVLTDWVYFTLRN